MNKDLIEYLEKLLVVNEEEKVSIHFILDEYSSEEILDCIDDNILEKFLKGSL